MRPYLRNDFVLRTPFCLWILVLFSACPHGGIGETWDFDRSLRETLAPMHYRGVLSETEAIPVEDPHVFGVIDLPWKVERTSAKGFFIFNWETPERFQPRSVALVLEANGPTRVWMNGKQVLDRPEADFKRVRIPLEDGGSGAGVIEIRHGDSQARLQSAFLEAYLPGLEEVVEKGTKIFQSFNQYGPEIEKFLFVPGRIDSDSVPPFGAGAGEEVAKGYHWNSDQTFGWFYADPVIPETIGGRPTAQSKLLLSVQADRRSRLFLDGAEISGKETDGQPTVFEIPKKWEAGKKTPLVIRAENFAGRGGLWRAEWRLQEIDEGIETLKQFEKQFDEIARILRHHDRPDLEWVSLLEKSLVFLEAPKQNLSLLPEAVSQAGEQLQGLHDRMDAVPTFTINPYLQDVRADRVTIFWETSAPVASKVLFGKEMLDQEKVEEQSASRVHAIEIQGLQPDTRYQYQVHSGVRESEVFSFQTAPSEDRPFSFLLWGDNQSGVEMSEKVFSRMAEEPSDFVINVGDLVDTGSKWHEWREQCFTPLRHWAHSRPTYVAIGNHCQKGFWVNGKLGKVTPFETYFRMPDTAPGASPYFYSLHYSNAHFIFIDPLRLEEIEDSKVREGVFIPEDDPNLIWLQEELARHDPNDWLFLFMHEPPYSQGWAGSYYDGEAHLRQSVVPILEKHGVDVVFSGHMHGYERGLPHPPYDPVTGMGNTISYVISGGGGGSLDNHKYREWPAMDLPDHPANPNSHEPDGGEYYRHHFCKVEISGNEFVLKAIEVLPDGRRGPVLDSFRLVK